MEAETVTLAGAATIAVVHTLAGPDHYVPFIALGRSQNWSMARVVVITVICGIAHVLTSVLLGGIAAAVGSAMTSVEAVQEAGGTFAGSGLIVLGALYALWGAWWAWRNRGHSHVHTHGPGFVHRHPHEHEKGQGHSHAHLARNQHDHTHGKGWQTVTPWALFLIFAFGPCEPLIAYSLPLGMTGDWIHLATVAVVFGAVTVVTMLAVVMVSLYGLTQLKLSFLGRYAHLLSGLAIFLSGAGIMWFGL